MASKALKKKLLKLAAKVDDHFNKAKVDDLSFCSGNLNYKGEPPPAEPPLARVPVRALEVRRPRLPPRRHVPAPAPLIGHQRPPTAHCALDHALALAAAHERRIRRDRPQPVRDRQVAAPQVPQRRVEIVVRRRRRQRRSRRRSPCRPRPAARRGASPSASPTSTPRASATPAAASPRSSASSPSSATATSRSTPPSGPRSSPSSARRA